MGMWGYFSSVIPGGSLSPEWNDNSRTSSGVQTNNSLGWDLVEQYGKKVIVRPNVNNLNGMYQASGPSSWAPSANTNRIIYTPFATSETYEFRVPVGVST
jgi:hypothetical protein